MKIIEVRDFSFRYANGSRESLSHVSLDVEEGTFNVLCGKSATGSRARKSAMYCKILKIRS